MKNKVEKKKYCLIYILIFAFFLGYGLVSGIYHDDAVVGERVRTNGLLNVYKEDVALGGWSSRFIVDFIWLLFLDKIPFDGWIILNALFPTCTIFVIEKLYSSAHKNVLHLLMICSMVFTFPYITVQTAGMLATTITYWWTACCAVMSIVLIYQYLYIKKSIYVYMFAFITGIYGADDELGCVFCVVACVMTCILSVFNKKNIKEIIFLNLFFISRLGIHYYWKSCGHRLNAEIINWYPDYQQQNIFDKLQIGFSSLCYSIFKEYALPLFLLCVVLSFLVFSNYKTTIQRVIGIIPLIIVAVQGIFRNQVMSVLGHLPRLDEMYSAQYGMISNSNYYSWQNYLLLFLWGVAILCIIVAIIYVTDNSETFLVLGLLGAGFISKLAMGFSPTVAASGVRTASFLFLSIIVATVVLLKRIERCDERMYVNVSWWIIAIGGVSYINNLLSLVW